MKHGVILTLVTVIAFSAPQDTYASGDIVQSFQVAQVEKSGERSNTSEGRAARERRVQHMEEVMMRRQERGVMPEGFETIDWTNSSDLTLEQREERIENILTHGRGQPE